MGRRLAYSLISLLTAFFLLPAAVLADTRPYFKVYGGDVFAGGWINNGATSCSTSSSNYQAPWYSNSPPSSSSSSTSGPVASPGPVVAGGTIQNQYAGGILAFANSTRHGASVDFGAFAMGLIEGDATNVYGFYSGPSSFNTLSLSNTNNVTSSYWGGYYAGTTPQIHCIPDYYTTKQNNPTNLGTADSVNLNSLSNGQYIVTPIGSSVDISPNPSTISTGSDVTLFVNGNAYISHDIKYTNGYNITNVPKLAVVVKGNLYVAGGAQAVSQMDGLYIAQPTSGSTGGTIWTCHDNTTNDPDGNWTRANCSHKLTINGALIAKQVNFGRINGNVASAGANEASTSGNIAEVINYIPAMVIGGQFFNPPASSGPTFDSLISLPPVF